MRATLTLGAYSMDPSVFPSFSSSSSSPSSSLTTPNTFAGDGFFTNLPTKEIKMADKHDDTDNACCVNVNDGDGDGPDDSLDARRGSRSQPSSPSSSPTGSLSLSQAYSSPLESSAITSQDQPSF